MSEHLAPLQVVVPLVGAPLCLVIRHGAAARALAMALALISLAISIALLRQVLDGSVISYALGGWVAPLGIEYRVDTTNAFVLVIVSAVSAVVLPVGPGAGGHSIPAGREYLFYALFLLCMAGLLGVTISGDAFNIFVFLEISSLAAYGLVSLGKSRRALRAAFSYLVMGTIGGTFFLLGVGFM